MRNSLMIGAIVLAGCGSAASGAAESDETVSSGEETVSSGDETTEVVPAAAQDDVAVWERRGPGQRPVTREGAFAVLERVEVRGSMSLEQARRRARRGVWIDVGACYRQGVERDSELEGTVVLLLSVGADGSVVSVEEAGGGVADPEVAACAREAAAGWLFVQNDGPSSVEIRVTLTQTFVTRGPLMGGLGDPH